MKCNNCGNELKNGTALCEYCGTKVEGAAPQPPVNNQVYGGYPQPPKSSGTGLKVVIIIIILVMHHINVLIHTVMVEEESIFLQI